MSVYLHDIPLAQALTHFRQALQAAEIFEVLAEESIPLTPAAVGRVLAQPVWARISSPHYHASAMDGFAVRAEETIGASQTNPTKLGYSTQAQYVDTGDLLPEEFNAVVPIENVESLDQAGEIAGDSRSPAEIRIRSAVTPWSHVRPMGEDMIATQLVLPAGHVLRPVDLGAVAGSGHDSVTVSRKPRVAVIPTGTELVAVGEEIKPGDIIEYNSLVLAAQIEQWGGAAN